MTTSLLTTKLYIPPVRPNLVPRPRLMERLNEGLRLGRKLTFASAPAGFGKITLVSEWVAGCERPAAWLSLDEGDNDPTRFLAYLIAALQTMAARQSSVGDIGEGALAALSMQGRADSASFIQAFTGSHYFVLDYLVEEVLQHQPEHVRGFLLQTSILDRLCGPLCDAVLFGKAEKPSSSEETAVTGREDGRGMLEALERGNLFVVRLDDQRQWYRYHHLFADVLQAHLMEEQPDRVPTLHRRASEWYEHHGSPSDAVRHALSAEDFERAAGLVELAWHAMDSSSQSATWLGWVKALPDELVRARPVFSVGYAWALLNSGELEAAESCLRNDERWLDTTVDTTERPEAPAADMVVVDEEQFRSLPASIATARAYHAQALGDVHATVKHARRVLELLPEGDHLRRGQATTLLGLAYWASGDLEAAHQSFADFMAMMRIAGNIPEAISGAFVLAEPEGYVRIFVDEDPPMAVLLREATKHGSAPNYVSRLRAAFGKAEGRRPVTQPLMEPLSERELVVLRLLCYDERAITTLNGIL